MESKNFTNNFITEIIDNDIESKISKKIITRFPPEPNGYLHIGHAKSIYINFSIAEKYGGQCNLRFDDTNPLKENIEYVNSIIEDIKWLGFQWHGKPLYASDYFDQMFDFAIDLIKKGLAYVDDQTSEEIKNNRGTLNSSGQDSPYRIRSINENIDLFQKMKNGDFQDGEKVLRAKINMASPNINLRDPIIYRILHAKHHRTGNKWCIYPMYDWAHGIEDSLENISHSICTLEFEDHRPLYDWFLEKINVFHPKQIEFARLNLNFTVMSKRKLKILVDNKIVEGWDDPRMPTISGLRRRGYSPKSIRNFICQTGVVKRNGITDISLLEHSLRDHLNQISQRVMAVLNPLKVVITNFPKDQTEYLDAKNNPENKEDGTRLVPFSREIYIEKNDFLEDAPKKFFRLSLNKEVRLLHAYYIICTKIIKNHQGEIVELHCQYDPKSKGGWTEDGRKVKGTIHWVSIPHAVNAQINLYNRLFNNENPLDDKSNFLNNYNSDSLKIVKNAKLEPSLRSASLNSFYQFVRTGYFSLDKKSSNDQLYFNQSVSLRDSWSKKNKS